MVVVYGSGSGLTATGSQLWDQNALGLGNDVDEPDTQFGSALGAGDFNGDGKIDLAVGVPGKTVSGISKAGEVNVIYGSSFGLSNSAVRIPQVLHDLSGAQSHAQFGFSLTAWNFGRNETFNLLGRIIVVSAADLAVGVPYRTLPASITGAGAVDVFYGSYLTFSNGLVSANSQVLTANSIGLLSTAGAHFGFAIY